MLKQLESMVKQLSKKDKREAKKAEKRKEDRERDRMAAEEALSRRAASGTGSKVSALYSYSC